MKIGILLIILFITSFIIGCVPEKKELPLSEKHPTNELIEINPEDISETALKCELGKIYYLKKKFVYHINDKEDQLIYSPVGTYTKYNGRTAWTLVPYLDKKDSIYLDTISWILNGEFPNEEKIECVETLTIPKSFERFIGSHYFMFKNVTVNLLENSKYS